MRALLPETWIAQAWQPPLVAFAAALAGALLLASAGRRRHAGAAAAAGLVLALFLVFGARMVTPRMLPERLPWLVLAAGVVGLLADIVALGFTAAWMLAASTALGATWFMLGAPRAMPDFARVVVEALPVLVGFAVPLWRLVPASTGPSATSAAAGAGGVLALGLWLAGSALVFPGVAATVAAAAAGTVAASTVLRGTGTGFAGALGLAAGLGGVVAASGLALRSPATWAACLAPLVGLSLWGRAARLLGLPRDGVLAPFAAVLVGGLPLAALARLLRGSL